MITVLQDDSLVIALGAASALPLGSLVRVMREPRSPGMGQVIKTPEPGQEGKRTVTTRQDIWLAIKIAGESENLRSRQSAALGAYDIYVERCWRHGIPGTDECVAISERSGPVLRDAAMSSAILIAAGSISMLPWKE